MKVENDFSDLVFENYGEGCHLTFLFDEQGVLVQYADNKVDCGFGHAVFAHGEYLLVDKQTPVLGCLSMTNPCRTTPEQ